MYTQKYIYQKDSVSVYSESFLQLTEIKFQMELSFIKMVWSQRKSVWMLW